MMGAFYSTSSSQQKYSETVNKGGGPPLYRYLWQSIRSQPWPSIVLGLIAVASYAGQFLGLGENWSSSSRWIFSLSLVSIGLLTSIVLGGFSLHKALHNEFNRLHIISISQGEGYYEGERLVVFGSTSWLEYDQVITVYIENEEKKEPICLLRVVDFNQKFGQAVIYRQLVDDAYAERNLFNQSAWKHLRATNLVIKRHIDAQARGELS